MSGITGGLEPEWLPVLDLVDKVCAEEAVPRPEVEFVHSPHAEALGNAERWMICIPDPKWAVEFDPDVFEEGRYRLLVLHELAHHIAWVRHSEKGHTPFMYAKLFQLCVRHNVDLTWAYENETNYKPRAAKRGWNLFTRWALA